MTSISQRVVGGHYFSDEACLVRHAQAGVCSFVRFAARNRESFALFLDLH